MPVIAVMYPSAGGSSFDEAYYLSSHIPLVKRHWGARGLEDVTVLRGQPGPGDAPPLYSIMALLRFRSLEAFQEAARSAEGKEIFDDISNFTTAKPVVQVSEAIG